MGYAIALGLGAVGGFTAGVLYGGVAKKELEAVKTELRTIRTYFEKLAK